MHDSIAGNGGCSVPRFLLAGEEICVYIFSFGRKRHLLFANVFSDRKTKHPVEVHLSYSHRREPEGGMQLSVSDVELGDTILYRRFIC